MKEEMTDEGWQLTGWKEAEFIYFNQNVCHEKLLKVECVENRYAVSKGTIHSYKSVS